MTPSKLHIHRVTLNDRRREKKQNLDMLRKGIPREDIQHIFDTYYRDQVRALYRAVMGKT